MIMATISLNKESFLRKIDNYEANPTTFEFLGERPALIDFYATWCGPCKALAPVIEALSEEYEGRVDFYKIDVDQEEELAALFNVRSIPTLIFVPMKGGPQITQGAMPQNQLREAIENILLQD